MNCTWYTTESWAEPISEVKLTWLVTWKCLEMRLRVDQGTKCKKTAWQHLRWQLQQEIIVTLELSNYLADQGQHQDVLTAVEVNRLTGADFLELTSSHLKELFPVLGARMSVQRLISSFTSKPAPNQQSETPLAKVSFNNCLLILYTMHYTLQVRTSNKDWVKTFKLPDRFNNRTMKSLREGVITKAARIDIIGSLYTLMMQNDPKPNGFVYEMAWNGLHKAHGEISCNYGQYWLS